MVCVIVVNGIRRCYDQMVNDNLSQAKGYWKRKQALQKQAVARGRTVWKDIYIYARLNLLKQDFDEKQTGL